MNNKCRDFKKADYRDRQEQEVRIQDEIERLKSDNSTLEASHGILLDEIKQLKQENNELLEKNEKLKTKFNKILTIVGANYE